MKTIGSGITYFAGEPLRSDFHEPQKNKIYFLNVMHLKSSISLLPIHGYKTFAISEDVAEISFEVNNGYQTNKEELQRKCHFVIISGKPNCWWAFLILN